MSIKRINEFPEGSGSLSNDDVFLFMDNPSGGGTTKKISLSQIANAIGGGGNANTGDITFDSIKIIGSGTGSGDGSNKGTIELVPDNTLYNNDQYLIVDPTGPNHIHLRAGGDQDGSNAELILGGELAHVSILDYTHEVKIKSDGIINQGVLTFRSEYAPNTPGFALINSPGWDGSDYVPIGSKFIINDTEYTITTNNASGFDPFAEITFTPADNLYNWIQANENNLSVAFMSPSVPHEWAFNNQGHTYIPGNIYLTNGTSVATGTFDNGTYGQNGVSLNCAVGYELNWQGGRLKSTANGGQTAAPIYVDSPMSISPVTVEISYSSTINVDAKYGDMFDIALTGNATLANPTNPVNGKTLRWRITQDSTGNRTVTLGNKFNIPSSATSPLPFSTAPNKMDILAATYHAGRDKWDVIAFVPGY